MLTDQEIKDRAAAGSSLFLSLQAALLTLAVYRDVGELDSEVEGARQTATSIIATIEGHLAALKGVCQ